MTESNSEQKYFDIYLPFKVNVLLKHSFAFLFRYLSDCILLSLAIVLPVFIFNFVLETLNPGISLESSVILVNLSGSYIGVTITMMAILLLPAMLKGEGMQLGRFIPYFFREYTPQIIFVYLVYIPLVVAAQMFFGISGLILTLPLFFVPILLMIYSRGTKYSQVIRVSFFLAVSNPLLAILILLLPALIHYVVSNLPWLFYYTMRPEYIMNLLNGIQEGQLASVTTPEAYTQKIMEMFFFFLTGGSNKLGSVENFLYMFFDAFTSVWKSLFYSMLCLAYFKFMLPGSLYEFGKQFGVVFSVKNSEIRLNKTRKPPEETGPRADKETESETETDPENKKDSDDNENTDRTRFFR